MCEISGCYYPAATYSRYCERHRETDRDHGHPLQRGVTKHELKPYIHAVERYLQQRSGERVQYVIEKAWRATVIKAEEFMEAAKRGKPHNRNEWAAAELIVDVSRECKPMEIALTVMAMGFWYQDAPRRWASDDGFRCQTVRMFKRLGKSTARYKWHSEDGKMIRSSYPRTPKRTINAIWDALQETQFIDWGVGIARETEKARVAKQRDRIAETLEVLGPLSSVAKGAA